jgi:flagellum-specific peptidoglycan hydrolase FlgJ
VEDAELAEMLKYAGVPVKEGVLNDDTRNTWDHLLDRFRHEVEQFKQSGNLDDDLYVIKTLASQVDSVQAMYIEKYAYIAVNEQTKYGFPASVKIAQFLLEGGFSIQNPEGSELVTQNQNPFGIRYFGDNVPSRIDDWHNLAFSKNWIKLYSDCKITHCKYVKFKSIWHSFRYHSLFMVGTPNNPSHYVGYINDGTWVDWLNALDKGGYATSDAYRYTLRNIIIRYKLYLLDKHKIYI